MKIYNLFIALISNNTDISSKSFMLLWGAFISTLIIVVFTVIEFIRLFTPELSYKPDYFGWTALLGGIGTMVGAVVWGKIKSESYQFRGRFPMDDFKGEEIEDNKNINQEDGL